MESSRYQSGFGNHFATEALAGTLPQGQNSPQQAAHGLYTEQISGSSFTIRRSENLRSWLYRIQPSVVHPPLTLIQSGDLCAGDFSRPTTPNQLRWDPLPHAVSPEKKDFLEGLAIWAESGDLKSQQGCGVYLYACNQSMKDRFFQDSDGELLIVPQEGALLFRTEFGELTAAPGEIAVIPRGVKFQALLGAGVKQARGYVCENYGAPFRLPDLGVIGSNGLANPRDFEYPIACFEQRRGSFELAVKFQGHLWGCELDHSPLDVVAWHGNYAPYRYNLKNFQVVNTVSFDHSDPSIFTVLSSPSEYPGVANIDFVIFPPRWMVAEHTFRPPYFHRNCMSEFMGMIRGVYDGKTQGGFEPGASSLHNCMSAHGPDAGSLEKAAQEDLKPVYQKDALAMMFESRWVFRPTAAALDSAQLQKDYSSCWRGIEPKFAPPK